VIATLFGMATTIIMLILAGRLYYRSPKWIDQKIEDTLAIFLKPDKEGHSMLDGIGERIGVSIKMGFMGQKSGVVRHNKMIEGRVFDAIKENVPEIKIGLKIAEKVGLGDLMEDPADAMAVMGILKNRFGIDVTSFLKQGNPANHPGRESKPGTVPLM